MSFWTHITGTITVSPLGRSQAEKRYILDTVLSHLPKVTGSERDMNIYVIQKNGFDSSCTHDEFGQYSNLGNGDYAPHASFEQQSEYLLVVNGDFRDRLLPETVREFTRWLCRLSKRVFVEDILVEVSGYSEKVLFDNRDPFYAMFENPSWHKNKTGEHREPNWCEFLMWDRAKESPRPMTLAYKYYADEENDREVERRRDYYR